MPPPPGRASIRRGRRAPSSASATSTPRTATSFCAPRGARGRWRSMAWRFRSSRPRRCRPRTDPMNLAMLLDMAAEAFGERTAVSCGPDHLSYTRLRSAAQAAARELRHSPCSHAALLDTNGLNAPITLFAAAYAGLPYVPLNYRLTSGELEELLQRVAPAWLVAPPEQLARLRLPAGVSCADAAHLREAVSAGDLEFPEGPAVAIQLFTSGTTGTPKAAAPRPENFMSYIRGTVEFGAAAEEEAALVAVPPYH